MADGARPVPGYDVAIVGAGAAGAGLATTLARGGLSVLLLERATEYRDKVRGESIVPWGGAELARVGLTDVLIGAGGHWARRWIAYDELVRPEDAEGRALDLGRLVRGVPGSLNIAHPVLCRALRDSAVEAGADVRMGVAGVRVEGGSRPAVEFEDERGQQRATARLVIAADGRSSGLRRQLGMEVRRSDPPHLLSGLHVGSLADVKEDAEVQAVEGGVYFLGMPQGGGRARVYLGLPHDSPHRFTGPDAARDFMRVARCECMPDADAWAAGEPIGPVATFTAEDVWLESPVGEGVVFAGDAAGFPNPLIGQGLALSFRDVRILTEALLGDRDWSPAAFEEYARERRTRIDKVRSVGRLYVRLFMDFSAGARERRARVAERLADDPRLALPIAAMFAGPERVPSAAFVDRAAEALVGAAPASV